MKKKIVSKKQVWYLQEWMNFKKRDKVLIVLSSLSVVSRSIIHFFKEYWLVCSLPALISLQYNLTGRPSLFGDLRQSCHLYKYNQR